MHGDVLMTLCQSSFLLLVTSNPFFINPYLYFAPFPRLSFYLSFPFLALLYILLTRG
jgi:hypothetical protein